MTFPPFLQYLKRFGPEAGLFLAYVIAGRIGLSFHPIDGFAPVVWPAAGIALAVLVLYGYRLWPAVFLAAFAVYLSVGAGFLVSFGIALGETLQCLAGAYFLQRYVDFNPAIARLRDNVALVAVAVVAPLISSALGVASLWSGGDITAGEVGTAFSVWWVGSIFGILILAPLLFKWLSRPLFQRTPLQYLELGIVVVLTFVTSIFIFWMPQGPVNLDYYIFIPLTWAALRTGPRGIALAIFVAASVAISSTFDGHSLYLYQGLLYLQIYIGTLSGLFLIFTAIVEDRKQAQVLLKQHVGELEHSLHKVSSEDEAKKDFLAILAHELRNPLATILSSVELLRLQEVHAPDTTQLLQTIDEHVKSMTVMLDDLLDVSRISRNKLTLRKEMLSLDSLMDRSVRAAQTFIRNRGHTLSVVKPEHELYLEADPIRIEQILVNLLNNAAKYTEPNGSIQLSARKEGDLAVIRVRDSGIGIPKNMLKRIFEPFFQVQRGRLSTDGLGIGLPLTHQLVEMHGGSIEATSDGAGRGSEFVVRLPLPAHMPPPAAIPKLRAGRAPRHVKDARSILVVDDNEVAAQALGRLLELRGHTIDIAYNGLEAVDKARQSRPHIIILDIGLPDIDGYEVARRLQEEKNFPSVLIALTGYGQPQDKERALSMGFRLYLTKPVGLKEIEAAFRKVAHAPERQAP